MGKLEPKNIIFGRLVRNLNIDKKTLCEIRVCPLEKSLKINKRAGTLIPHSRAFMCYQMKHVG